MTEDNIWQLLSLQLSGEATPEELAALDKLLRERPELQRQAAVIKRMWAAQHPSSPAADRDRSFQQHIQRLDAQLDGSPALPETTAAATGENRPYGRNRRLWAGSLAAAAVCAFAVLLFQYYQRSAGGRAGNTISTKAGSKSKVQLPDGTQVWLNADSKISYKADFMASREVQLTGEAYFDVAPYRGNTFVIHTGTIVIKVLGTAFNVRSYPSESTTATTLLRGAIEVTLRNHPRKRIILQPDEKLIVQNNPPALPDTVFRTEDNKAAEPAPVLTLTRPYKDAGHNACIETMWLENRLAFESMPLTMIAAEIERWYNVEVIIKNEALASVRLRGIFENKSLAEVMEALRLPGHFNYDIKDGVVTIW